MKLGGAYKIQAPIFIIKFDRPYIAINIIKRNMIEKKLELQKLCIL